MMTVRRRMMKMTSTEEEERRRKIWSPTILWNVSMHLHTILAISEFQRIKDGRISLLKVSL